jgi:hypothetical protein
MEQFKISVTFPAAVFVSLIPYHKEMASLTLQEWVIKSSLLPSLDGDVEPKNLNLYGKNFSIIHFFGPKILKKMMFRYR